MAEPPDLINGEYARTLDERYRLSLPPELLQPLCFDGSDRCVLAKERLGCLSLWHAGVWRDKVQSGLDLIKQKIQAHRLEGRLGKVQQFGRLLSTRFREVRLGERGRLVLPEGFRDFLGVQPGAEFIVVGAAICVELWHPDRWRHYLQRRMPQFHALFEELGQ